MPTPDPTSHPERPDLDERRAYVPRGRQEEFIVPLLRSAIESAIRDAAATMAGRSDGRALDVGCGGQPFRRLVESVGYAYTGIDTQAQPGLALDHHGAIDGDLPAGLLDAAVRSPRGGFDLVLCTEVLEHVLDWSRAWTNLSRLLAPGGRLIITCPHVYPLHEEPYDFWRPTMHALRAFAARAGLEIIEERALGDAFDVLGTVNASTTPDPAQSGPVAWAASRAARRGRKLLHTLLRSRWVRRQLVPRSAAARGGVGDLYLSNFIVLTRAGRAAAAHGDVP
ncbi:MAG: class I SAM-dependent methyltransferase [Phycisphaeraceae bacterium]|nr:class I SAM-dependent methyltransferase [Phycisphaeraceae bacterium]